MKRRSVRHHRRGAISGRQLDSALRVAGFSLTRCHGGHRIYHHESGRAVTVPAACMGRDLKPGMIASINNCVRVITGTDLEF